MCSMNLKFMIKSKNQRTISEKWLRVQKQITKNKNRCISCTTFGDKVFDYKFDDATVNFLIAQNFVLRK